jgi:hypothetical protein
VGKKRCYSEIQYLLDIFRTGLNFQSLEEVTSSGELSEDSVAFRALNEGPAEIGNTFTELVPEVEGAQIGAIFGGDVSINVTVSLLSEMEEKYSGPLWLFKG